MIVIHKELEQGSDRWKEIRRGILTASEMKNIVTPKFKVADNDKTRSHVYEIAAQRISKFVEPSYISDDMLRGELGEIEARNYYAKKYAPVEQVGFITNDEFGYVLGYSPDGLVGTDGVIEIKSPRQKSHVETVSKDEVPEEYIAQIQTGLLVSGRKWCDYISYHGGLHLYVKRVYSDPAIQSVIIEASSNFEVKVQECINNYKEKTENLILTERVIEEEITV
jgi:putative phage-type endonuclease